MKIQIKCEKCAATQELEDEPKTLIQWKCPGCQAKLPARASEDFASALEDALAQLWLIGRHVRVQVEMDSDQIPPAFQPPDDVGSANWDD